MAGELDAKLWSTLPTELVDRVLHGLPISSLCRFRAVCKHWNTMPTVSAEDPYFLGIPFRTLTFGPSFPFHFNRCKLYSFTRNEWEDFDFSFLAQHCLGGTSGTVRLEKSCSDGGLLFLSGATSCNRDIDNVEKSFLLVCNPLTGATKFLPRIDTDNPVDLSRLADDYLMYRDPSSGAYKIFAIVAFRARLHYYMYDSNLESWKLILTLRQDVIPQVNNLQSCSIVFNGVYYSVGGTHAYSLSAYNIHEDRWVVSGVKTVLLSSIKSMSFVVSNNCLLLLVMTRRSGTRVYRIEEMKLSRLDGSEEIKIPRRLIWSNAFSYGDIDILFLKVQTGGFAVVDIGDAEAVKTRSVPLFPTRFSSLNYIYGKVTFNFRATL